MKKFTIFLLFAVFYANIHAGEKLPTQKNANTFCAWSISKQEIVMFELLENSKNISESAFNSLLEAFPDVKTNFKRYTQWLESKDPSDTKNCKSQLSYRHSHRQPREISNSTNKTNDEVLLPSAEPVELFTRPVGRQSRIRQENNVITRRVRYQEPSTALQNNLKHTSNREVCHEVLPTTYQQFAPELHGINQVATDEVFFRHISSENILPQVTSNSSSQPNKNTTKHVPSQQQINRFDLAKDAGVNVGNKDTFLEFFGDKSEWGLYLDYTTNKENSAGLDPYKITPEKIAFPLINGEIGEEEKQLFNQILNDPCLVEVKTEAQFLEQTNTIEKAFPKHEINFDRFKKYRKMLPPRDMIQWEKKDNKINIKCCVAKNNGLKNFIKK